MKTEHFVIIGNGAAGNRAADVLRTGEPDARITLISDEFIHFYYRHRLSDFLAGDCEESDLLVRSSEEYREQRIRLRLGQRVVRVDFPKKTLYLQHMEVIRYDRLLLCVGGRPRVPEIYYACRDRFTVFKTVEDARHFRRKLAEVDRVVIVGGDLISLKVAEVLVRLGKKVSFLVDRDAFWPLEADDGVRHELSERLTAKGIEVVGDDGLALVESAGRAGLRVSTRAGRTIPCEMVGAFFGLVPAVDFLLGSGLDIDRGILVDEYLQTSVPGVFAAGDCAQVYNPAIRNYWVSIGWPNARLLGEVAALNMLGQGRRADHVPVNALEMDGLVVNTCWWRRLQ